MISPNVKILLIFSHTPDYIISFHERGYILLSGMMQPT